jgi:hypothetical protein
VSVPFVFRLPMFYGLFFACSISIRSVACGALPCMCLKYRKSSPRCAITFRSGSRFRSWVNLSWIPRRDWGRERMGERYQSNCALHRIISLYVGNTEVIEKVYLRLRELS